MQEKLPQLVGWWVHQWVSSDADESGFVHGCSKGFHWMSVESGSVGWFWVGAPVAGWVESGWEFTRFKG